MYSKQSYVMNVLATAPWQRLLARNRHRNCHQHDIHAVNSWPHVPPTSANLLTPPPWSCHRDYHEATIVAAVVAIIATFAIRIITVAITVTL